MKFTINTTRNYHILQARINKVAARCDAMHPTAFDSATNQFAHSASVAEQCTLLLARNKLIIHSFDDPVEDWNSARALFLSTSRLVVGLWVIHGISQTSRVWWKRDIETNDIAFVNSSVVSIGKAKWTATCSSIPHLLVCFAILIGSPIFKMRKIWFGLSRRLGRFTLVLIMASI